MKNYEAEIPLFILENPEYLAAHLRWIEYRKVCDEPITIAERVDRIMAKMDAEEGLLKTSDKVLLNEQSSVGGYTSPVEDFVAEVEVETAALVPQSPEYMPLFGYGKVNVGKVEESTYESVMMEDKFNAVFYDDSLERTLVNIRIKSIAERACCTVEKQVFGMEKLAPIMKDIDDMMPTLKATLFDTRVIVDQIRGYMPAIESTLRGGAFVGNMVKMLQDGVASMVDTLDGNISFARKKIKELISGVEAHPLESFLIIACVGIPLFCFSKKCRDVGWLAMVILPFGGAAYTGHLRTMIEYIVCNYNSIFKFPDKGRKGVNRQAGVPQFSEQSAVYLLLVAMSLIVMGMIPSQDKINKMVKGFGDVGRNMSGISQGIKVAKDFSSHLTECFFELMSDANMTDDNLVLLSKMAEFDVIEWMKKVHEYSLEENKYTVFAHPTKHKEVRKLYEEAQIMIKTICSKSLPVGLSRQMEKTIDLARKLRNDLNSFKGLGCRRFDPYHVSFSGVPGVGKSGMTNKFIDNWMDAMGESKIDRYYSRVANSPYWSGYQNQTLVSYDDFTAVISQGESSDVIEMIAIKSNCPLMLNMASLEEKGRHFVSRYIVSSTNTEYISSEANLRSTDAFHRRRDSLIRCEFAPGFGPIDDPTTKNAGEDENELDGSASHMRFVFLNPKVARLGENEMYGGKRFRYHEMFAIIVENTAKHMVRQHELQTKILGDGFGRTFAERMKVDLSAIDPEDKEGMNHVENYYAWCQAFRRVREDPIQGLDDLIQATVEVQAYFNDKTTYAETMEKWDAEVLGSKCIIDENGDVMFFLESYAEKYEKLEFEQKKLVAEFAKQRMKKLIELNDLETVMYVVPYGNRRLMADMLKETKLIVKTRDLEGKPLDIDIECITDDARYAWEDFSRRERYIFGIIRLMYDQCEMDREEWTLKQKAIGNCKSFFQRAWDTLTQEKRQAMRIAYSAGGIMILAYSIFGAYKYFAKEEEEFVTDEAVASMPTPEEKLAAAARIEAEGGGKEYDERIKRGRRDQNRRIRMECQYLRPCKFFNQGKCKNESSECTNLHVTYEQFNNPEVQEEIRLELETRGYCTIAPEGGKGKGAYEPTQRFGQKKKSILMEGGAPSHLKELFDDLDEEKEEVRQSDTGFTFIKNKMWFQRMGMGMEETAVTKQWCADPNAEMLIDNKISENTAILNWPGHYKMACLFITDSMLLAPKHFFQPMKEGAHFDVIVRGTRYEQRYDPAMFELVDIKKTKFSSEYVKDQGVYWCSARVQGCRSLIVNLATVKDHENFKVGAGLLVNAGLNTGATKVRERYLAKLDRTSHVVHDPTYEKVLYKMDDNASDTAPNMEGWHWVIDGYRYVASTVNGECGSAVIQFNPSTNGKIVGMHVAGSNAKNYGYAEAVVRELVEGAIERLRARCPTRKQCGSVFESLKDAIQRGYFFPDVYTNTLKAIPDGDITPMGTIPMDKAMFTPDKTGIHPSPIKEYMGQHLTEPAILSHKDRRLIKADGTRKQFDPLVKGISKYGKDCMPFDHRDLKIVKGYLVDKLRALRNPRGVMKELTLQECINGDNRYEYYDAINMVTSEGLPWVKSRPPGFYGKSWMFKETGEFDNGRPIKEIDEEITLKRAGRSLLEAYETRMSEARAGRRVYSLSTECTKDERRGMKKIYEDPNTRTFTILPVDFNMAIRTLFLDFSTLIMSNRESLPPQVGIDPESVEWTEMFKRITKNASMGFAGDYKNFDGQTCPELFQMVAEIVNELYDDGEENATARCVLMSEAYSRLSVCRDTIFNVKRGMPSGFPLTVIVNSIVNWTYLLLAWLNLAKKHAPEYATCSDFERFVDCIVYGDDNCVAINFEVIKWYNLKTVALWLRDYNIVLTDSEKRPAEEAEPFIMIEKMTFLKRAFVRSTKDSFFMLAPLEKQSIEERVRWVRESNIEDDDSLLLMNIDDSMRDAFYHGEKYFNDLKKRINNACIAAEKPQLCTRLQFDELERIWHFKMKGMAVSV